MAKLVAKKSFHGELLTLDEHGHSTLEWTSELEESVIKAKAAFDDFKAKGFSAYKMDGPKTGEMIKEFDPGAETIIMAPQLVGG